MSLQDVMVILSPEQQANLEGIIDQAGACEHCSLNSILAMRNACQMLTRYSILHNIVADHPEDPNQAAKIAECKEKRAYILQIDEAFYLANMQGSCDSCKEGIINAREEWTKAKRIWDKFDSPDILL